MSVDPFEITSPIDLGIILHCALHVCKIMMKKTHCILALPTEYSIVAVLLLGNGQTENGRVLMVTALW